MKIEQHIQLAPQDLPIEDFLKNIDTYSEGVPRAWSEGKFKYLLTEPFSGWEKVKERGGEIPEKPSDKDLIPFILFQLEEYKKESEELVNVLPGFHDEFIHSLELLQKYFANPVEQHDADPELDLVKALYDLDFLEENIDQRYGYINEKNRARGFQKKAVLYSIHRVRELINSQSLKSLKKD